MDRKTGLPTWLDALDAVEDIVDEPSVEWGFTAGEDRWAGDGCPVGIHHCPADAPQQNLCCLFFS